MNPGIETYRPWGHPASCAITFLKELKVGDAVIVHLNDSGETTYTYTYGTDFVGSNSYTIAQSLAAAVNADRARQDLAPTATNPIAPVYAVYYGSTVRLIATTPGTVGNRYTLEAAVSDETAVEVEKGGEFSGGLAGDISVEVSGAIAGDVAVTNSPSVKVHDGVGNSISSTSNALNVQVKNEDLYLTVDEPMEVEVTNASAIPVSIANLPDTSTSDLATINANTAAIKTAMEGTLSVEAINLNIRSLTSSDVVTVTGGTSQAADVKVTLDGETVGLTGNLPDTAAGDLADINSNTDKLTAAYDGTNTAFRVNVVEGGFALNTLPDTASGDLAAINSNTDKLVDVYDGTNMALRVNMVEGGLEVLPDTSAGDLAAINANTDKLTDVYDATNTALRVNVVEGGGGGSTSVIVMSSDTFTRPADTTAYAAHDSVSDSTSGPTAMEFTNVVASAGATATIVSAEVLTNVTITPTLRLHLFSTGPTLCNDNSAYTMAWSDRAGYLGFVDIGPLESAGTGSDMSYAKATTNLGNLPLPFKTATGSTSIYGVLETLDVFTPASAENFEVRLYVMQ